MFFLDCEASSLGDHSYPIEIAWVAESGQGESYLIRPEPTWTDWSRQAEGIHHISQAELRRDGQPADVVARRAMAVLVGQIIVSDNPSFDQYWLAKLLATVYQRELLVVSFDSIMRNQINRLLHLNSFEADTPAWHHEQRRLFDLGQTIVGDAVSMMGVKHRALADAEMLWRHWRTVKQRIDHLST